jgi:hypothetical protein
MIDTWQSLLLGGCPYPTDLRERAKVSLSRCAARIRNGTIYGKEMLRREGGFKRLGKLNIAMEMKPRTNQGKGGKTGRVRSTSTVCSTGLKMMVSRSLSRRC